MGKPNRSKCVKRKENVKTKNEIENNLRGEPKNDPREGLEKEPIKEIENVQEELENDNGEEHENVFIPERENDPSEESPALNDISIESVNDPRDDPENDPTIEDERISSWNSNTLEDIRDILYELHEYFDEFQIEIVACPDLTREPYKFTKSGISGDTAMLEVYTPNYSKVVRLRDSGKMRRIATGWNDYLSKRKPGMVLKIRAKGRKTNYNIINLIQNILHKRFSYKMGLGRPLLIQGGRIITRTSSLMYNNTDCNSNVCLSEIVNDPVIIEGQYDKLFYTNKRYMCYTSNEHGILYFLNDITPEKTEYVGYFDIAERMFYYY